MENLSDLTTMLDLKVELSKIRMKGKDDHEVLSSAFSVMKIKYEDAEDSVDETELVAVIAAVPKDYLSSMDA